ncbi:class II aldolase/adducin family protein [Paraburkholderia sp. UCT31]|uniref:class II aldolase/adducin family protein n=1 Tax=Paraburkholderia sp. UCT31 TaxID=2615209 RepID=UPI0016563809|nr:class II aldolase/adducin family protein [Paraburkholderia sp. UCT31]MBC8742504.1 class II aldolase/adducin family protein [Paraburkholderia sp. UCT31]
MNDPKVVVRSLVSEQEWQTRVDLAALYRAVAHYRWDDLIFTHLSAKIPGSDDFLINPFGLMFDEITASSLVKVNIEGDVLLDSGYGANKAGFNIHSAVHSGRSDVGCVMHLHTNCGSAVSALKDGLLPLDQTAEIIFNDVAYHEYEGASLNAEERVRLQADLGEKNTMILRNHGTLSVGRTIAEAFLRMYFLERACEHQVNALSMGREIQLPSRDTLSFNATLDHRFFREVSQELLWPALRRKLDRMDPGYAC